MPEETATWVLKIVLISRFVLISTFGDMKLACSGAKVQSRFYPGDLVTRTGDREIRSVSGCYCAKKSISLVLGTVKLWKQGFFCSFFFLKQARTNSIKPTLPFEMLTGKRIPLSFGLSVPSRITAKEQNHNWDYEFSQFGDRQPSGHNTHACARLWAHITRVTWETEM